ncbi:sulfatase family protein [Larkinella soli]|uniref:sulfatase family protein n=1 Tax=Larkinella soli TaxID=1770527 RepID=UPI000FFB8492|nr:sulfatase-like hydrolase/transferase [Larkinella soli]
MKSLLKRLFPVLMLPGLAAIPFSATPPVSSKADRPNLLFILTDDLGIGDLSGYGATDCRTPHLDSLMRAGLRFSNAYANSTVCSPTRASLLTGRYPDLVGVPGVIRDNPADSWGYLDPRARTLPQTLKKAGYHTALIGKWHLGLEAPNRPNDRGFDHFHGFLNDMMDDYKTHLRNGKPWMRLNQKPDDRPLHATDLFTDWTLDYLRTRKGQKAPFFLYLAYNAPHSIVQPPAEWLEKVKRRQPGITEKRAKLVALIEHLDDRIGRVMQALRANGQADRTLVVFTSDNGGALNEGSLNGPWRGGKQDMFEGGIRVPAFAGWAGQIRPGSQTALRTMTMDWFATLVEAAGLPVPADIDGVSLLPTLRGQNQTLDRTLIWVRRESSPYDGQDYYALRKGDWKLMQNTPFEPYALYHLADDPHEDRNVRAANGPVIRELIPLLREHVRKAGAVPWQKPQ